ncbi:dual specificity protein phosphatase family protein [Candidatus Bathyarchaeota archaeon]|nr:dual specificity protein phosphatase family protein [Candidatus Bathyarchaeota archaeon]
MPLSSFPGPGFGGLPSTLSGLSVTDGSSYERPMTSPSPRRARNMKGLSIQPPTIESSLDSEPASPSTTFIKPTIAPMKKRPSQLSLRTNTSDLSMRNTMIQVPPSPAMPPILQRRALKHSASTPHMLTGLKSSSFGPPGGMSFPKVLERNENGLSEMLRPTKLTIGGNMHAPIAEEDSPIRTQVADRGAMDMMGLKDETEHNEDQKSPAYPEGPVAIYEDSVFLYLEPTAEEAAKFDLVINVAQEVQNPFTALSEVSKAEPSRPIDSPIPDTALTDASFRTAFEYPPPTPDDLMGETTPTTPKAMFPPSQPEYIHMPWEHNTDISVDLMSLCEKVDRTVNDGKKVLIHCQQGASRSASLIIAYGLFRNPELSVNDAYYTAQKKSRWISPNMRLMYCLQDFQKQMSERKSNLGSALWQRSGRSSAKHRLTLSADNIDMQSSSKPPPLTAPLLNEDGKTRSPGDRGSARQKGNSTSTNSKAGPSSAPSTFSWREPEDKEDPGKPGRFNSEEIRIPAPREEPKFERPAPTLALPPPPRTLNLGLKPMDASRPPPTPGFPPRSFGAQPVPGFSFHQSMDAHLAPRDEPRERSITLKRSFVRDEPRERTITLQRSFIRDEPRERTLTLKRSFVDDSALMSPRSETMTSNPLREGEPSPRIAGMSFMEAPPAPAGGLFSPREGMFPRDALSLWASPPVEDPRSPATKGEAPIVRSIDELI